MSDKIIVVLWQELSPGLWKNTGIKFPLDAQNTVTKANAWQVKEYGYVPYLVGVTPGISSKPLTIPEEILNLESSAQGIRDSITRSKKLFEGSNKFFADRTREPIKPGRKVKFTEPQIIKRGSNLAYLLENLLIGASKDDLKMSLSGLQTILNQRGYGLYQSGDDEYKLIQKVINYG